MTNTTWPFSDDRNVAVFTSKRILNGSEWIYYVTHDEDDGAWQFHPYNGPTSEGEAAVVSLERMVTLDETLRKLADLPTGWHAWRKSADSEWERAPQHYDEMRVRD
jgi:hypothetical protein